MKEFERRYKPKEAENIYGKETPQPTEIPQIVRQLKQDFLQFYAGQGYIEHPSVQISSGIDPTVRFIGSHISVFKPYLASQEVPNPGYHMVQNCIRTRNTKTLFDLGSYSGWGSYFSSLGTIATPGSVGRVTQEAYDFLTNKVGIDARHMVARVNPNDTDLFQAASITFGNNGLEVGTMPERYYQHKLGMSGISGRNLNIALRNPDGVGFSDIGNIIIIETDEVELGVELAVGTSTTLKQVYGLDHVLDCHPVIGLEHLGQTIRRKMEDCIVITTALYREGLRPGGSDNRDRLLRTYARGLSYFRAITGIDLSQLRMIIADFEMREFEVGQPEVTDDIINDMLQFEEELHHKTDLSKEEAIIKPIVIGNTR